MLSVYVPRPSGLVSEAREPGKPLPADAIWIDLREVTPEEEQLVESTLSVDVPTREEMREIEASNRFYEENGSLYMTATLVTKLDTDQPERTQVTFILAGNKLITNRYTDPLPFRRFVAYAARHPTVGTSGSAGITASVVTACPVGAACGTLATLA